MPVWISVIDIYDWIMDIHDWIIYIHVRIIRISIISTTDLWIALIKEWILITGLTFLPFHGRSTFLIFGCVILWPISLGDFHFNVIEISFFRISFSGHQNKFCPGLDSIGLVCHMSYAIIVVIGWSEFELAGPNISWHWLNLIQSKMKAKNLNSDG